jgi:hypothetical protein
MSSNSASKIASATLVYLSAALGTGSVMAQSATPAQALLDNQWVVNLGAFLLNSNIRASLNGESVENPEIDFDETLGRDNDATRVRGDVTWRITPTHHLRFGYFNHTTNRSKVIDQVVNWGDLTFDAGAQVDSRHKLAVYELSYEYAFMKQPTYEVSASLGMHYSDTTLQLSGNATVTNPDGTTTNQTAAVKASNIPAPLPVIGLRGGWAVAPNWYLEAAGQYFALNYEGIDGSWSDLRASATWMFNRNFGLGLGYDRFTMRVNASKNDFNGKIKAGYSGVQAYLTGTF